MTVHRRHFLRSAAVAASGLALLGANIIPGRREDSGMETGIFNKNGAGIDPFGLQLYTLREEMPKDPRGTLKKVAAMGYKQVEGYEGKQGLWWQISEFSNYLRDLGLVMISSHCDIHNDFEKKVDEAAANGLSYLISPWIGPQKSLDDYKRYADIFNQRGEACKKRGLRFAYHNHGYTFTELEGRMPQDVLMELTDHTLVDFEMDIYWVITAGQDPEAWLRKYPNRFTLCHVKDRMKNADAKEQGASCDLGTGSINFPAILKTAAENGMKQYIVEQERYDNSTPLKSARAGANYMKRLRL